MAKRKLQLGIVLLLYVFLQTSPAHAQYTVGVSSGDWVKYDVTTYTQQLNQTSVIEIDVHTIQDTTVTGTYEVSLQGQTVVVPPSNFQIDVATQGSSFLTGVFIPANLALGQTIPSEEATIKNVTDWNGRKAVIADARAPYTNYPSTVYWDQATGVFLEASGSFQSSTEGNGTFRIVLTETSLWSTGLLSLGLEWLIIIIAAIIIFSFASVLAIMRRRKARSAQSPSQTTPQRKPEYPPS